MPVLPPVTTDATDWWIRHSRTSGEPWAIYYWEDWDADHRKNIALAISLLPRIDSLYEIGCNAGPNLRLIQHHFPHIRIGGSDVSPIAVRVGSEKLGVPLEVGVLPDSLEDDQRRWDVLVSCYTMAYLDDQAVRATLKAMTDHAELALILVEAMPIRGTPEGLCRFDLPEWRHDYRQILDQLDWVVEWKWPLLPPVGNLNTCLVAVPRRA